MEIKITNEKAKIIFDEVASRYCDLEELAENIIALTNKAIGDEIKAKMKVLDNFLLKLKECR